ncbi:hypothetical protein PMAYCL1PPCAC_14031, partial [Pristionchus mayeri]
LPSPLPGHDLPTIIHHSIVDTSAVILNCLLLLAIIQRSPKSLGSYKVLLISSAIIDLLSSFCMLLMMIRVIPAGFSLSYVYDGPCACVSGIFCHCIYTVMISTCSQSVFLIALSFFYRLYILGRSAPTNNAVFGICLIVFIPNLMVLTTFMFTLADSNDVRALLRELRPEYVLDDYVVEGHISIFNPLTIFAILAMTMPIGPTLIIIFIIRKRVLKLLSAHSAKMSGRTADMHSALARVLTLQSLLLVFFSGAVVSYALCQFEIMCSPVQEHFIMESLSFIAFLAPMITIYCITSYKQ